MKMLFGFASAIAALVVLSTSVWASEVTRQTTPAGHVFWHMHLAGAERTAVAINWQSGLGGLPDGEEVAARLGINLMLEGGAGGKGPEEIIADFEDLDAGSRLFIQPDQIRGFIVTADDTAQEAAAIANMVLREPNMEQRWFERLRKKLADEAAGRLTNVWGVAWTLARRVILGGHENERFWSLSPVEKIPSLELDTVANWRKRAFATGDLMIVAAGTNNVEGIAQAIDTALKGLPEGVANPVEPFAGPKVPGKTILFHAPWAEKSLVMAQAALPASGAGEDIKINIATGVLGYGQQSRLFKAVRDELRAAYRFGASMDNFTRSYRLLSIGGEVDKEKLADALSTMKKTYEEFRTGGIGLIEFPFARRFYGQRIDKEMKKPESVAYMLMESRLDGEPVDAIPTLRTRVGNLDRGEVNAFIAKTYPPFEDMLKIIVSPDADIVPGACVITSIEEMAEC